MSFERPKVEDTEDDLLEFQRQFLESGIKPAVKVVRKRKPVSDVGKTVNSSQTAERDIIKMDVDLPKKTKLDESAENDVVDDVSEEMDLKDTHITSVLTKIMERNTNNVPITFPQSRTNAFPTVYHRSIIKLGEKKQPKKSIFALQFKKKSDQEYGLNTEQSCENSIIESCGFRPLPSTIPMKSLTKLYPTSAIVSGSGLSGGDQSAESKKIHEENLERLSAMSESDALTERNKLLEEMSPDIVEFLRRKKSTAKDDSCRQIGNDTSTLKKNDKAEHKPSEFQPEFPTQSYLNMDVVEPEKLAWTEKIPKSNFKEVKSDHRFNFDGDIMDAAEDVPTHLGLHHHGDEPGLPGYTLDELFILSRSKFTQQRVLAITLLGKIIAKAKAGKLCGKTAEKFLERILEAGLLFLLRWSLDEQSETLIKASIFALHSLLCDPTSEDALNRIFVTDRGCEFPSLNPGVKIEQDTTDHDAAQKDNIAGLIRMKILLRLRYILEVTKPGTFVVGQCLEIIGCICRHSLQSAVAVYECPRLIDYVINTLILNPDGCRCPQSVALLRTMCLAGRHLSLRLLKDCKTVTTIIYKYIAGCNDGGNDNARLSVEIEVWRFWIVLCSYGLLCEKFKELFSIITKFIQFVIARLTNADNDQASLDLIRRAQLVCKLSATVLLSTKSRDLLEWKEITAQIEIMCDVLKKNLTESSRGSMITDELKVLYGSSLDYLSCYCNHLRSHTDPDIQSVTRFTKKIATTTLKQAFEYIKSIRYPSSIRETTGETVSALPRIMSVPNPGCICDFQLLSSYLQNCVTLISLDKSVCQHFHATVSHLAENCEWMLEYDIAKILLLKSRTYSLYWAALLHLKVVANTPPPSSKHSGFFFKAAFRCFGELLDGDEHMMHHMLSNALFHIDLLRSFPTLSTVTKDIEALDMSKVTSSMAPSPSKILESAVTALPSIRATYLQSLTIDAKTLEKSKLRYFRKVHDISSYLLPPSHSSCVPADWPFIPLLQLYDYSFNGSLPAGCLTHTANCLRYLCFIELVCKDCLDNVSLTAKLVRAMCVFIAGNDLFLEHPVRECLAFLFSHYCKSCRREDLDFSKSIPGISSFFDFFLSLLEQYGSVSFGDELFAAAVLLPLHQLRGGITDIKKALWCDHVELIRTMTVPISKLLIPLSWYLYPVENDVFVIRSYLRALATGNCSRARCPVLYTIAVHHTAGFLFDKSVDVHPSQRREIYIGVRKIRSEDIRKHILHYDRPASDDCALEVGFRFTEEATASRCADLEFLGR